MFSLKNERSWIRNTIFIVISIFFLICLYTVLVHGNEHLLGSFETFNNDDVKYVRSAWTLLDKGIFTYHDVNEPTVFIMPGLPFVMAGFMSIFGKWGGITAFRVFQVVLQSLSLYLIFLIGRRLFNSKVGLISLILSALYIPNMWAPNILLTEVIFHFLILLLVYITIYAVECNKLSYYISGGIVLGITGLFRPTIGAYPIIVLILWIYNKYTFKDMAKLTIIVTTVFALVMSPWIIRNYKVFHKFIPFTLSSGNPLIQGSYIDYNENIDYYPWKSVDDRVEQEKYYKENFQYRFKNYMLKRPFAYAKWYFIDKSIGLWKAAFYWIEIYNIHFKYVEIYHALLLVIGSIGMAKIYLGYKEKKYRSTALILFQLFAYFTIIHIPYVTFSRYSYPLIWIFIIGTSVVLEKAICAYYKSKKSTSPAI
ncbi:glycosyltransferase family 39 protein [Clostridium sp.]|uniref:glycosyltransferase family 39 protein n=1 Tax=Clostridium sp. TaxID=1506 RepID=UPI003463F0AE